jgi:A/G-specific adenine glycosylase
MLTRSQTERFQRALVEWFTREGRDYPWRRTRDPYLILVSEVMLQQTTVAMVIAGRYFERWLDVFPDVRSLAAAPEDRVLKLWEGLGYYNRARNLQRAARTIIQRHGGRFPNSFSDVLALPGVGRYTAGAVMAFAFDQPAAAVDGNAARVLARLFNFREPIDGSAGRRQIWAWAEALVPSHDARRYTSALIELGQRVCTAGDPVCTRCPVQRWCRAPYPGQLPVKRSRRAIVCITEDVLLARKRGKILLEQESGPRRRGLWKLPAVADRATGRELFGSRYAITHHRVTLRVHAARADIRARENEAWLAVSSLDDLAMPSPFRRALTALLDGQGKPHSPAARNASAFV